MDYSTAFNLIAQTYADQLHGAAVFETSTGESLRIDLSIEDQFFRAAFQDSTGRILVITPGSVTVVDNGQIQQSEQANTQSALDAWKSQPPITLAPITAGLAQLTTSNSQTNQVIDQIIPSSGSLAFSLIPDLCWFNAQYPELSIGKLQLKGVTGRASFRDIAFTSQSASFKLELVAKCKEMNWGLSTSPAFDNLAYFTELEVSLSASVFLDLVEQRVEANLIHAHFYGMQGEIRYISTNPSDPWVITLQQGFRLTLEDVVQDFGFASQASQSLRGQLKLGIPTATVNKNFIPLEGGGKLVQKQAAILTSTVLTLNLDSQTGRDDLTQGSLDPCQLTLYADYETQGFSVIGLRGTLALAEATFNQFWIDATFQIVGGIASQFLISIGKHKKDHLKLSSVILDLSACFQNQPVAARSVIHMHYIQVTAQDGELGLVLELVNDGSTDQPLQLILNRSEDQSGQAVGFVAQDFLAVTGTEARNTAKDLAVRIPVAEMATRLDKLQLIKWYELTAVSFQVLRQIDPNGQQHVPDNVLLKFEAMLINERFETIEILLSKLVALLTPQEIIDYQLKIVDVVERKETLLRGVKAKLDNVYLQGTLLSAPQSTFELYGSLNAESAKVSSKQIEGVEIDKLDNLTGVQSPSWYELTTASLQKLRLLNSSGSPLVPNELIDRLNSRLLGKRFKMLNDLTQELKQLLTGPEFSNYNEEISQSVVHQSGDSFEARAIQLILPGNHLSLDAAGLIQQFKSVDVNLGGAIVEIRQTQSVANLIRLTYAEHHNLTGQISVPEATLKSSEQNIPLRDIQIGLHRQEVAPRLSSEFRGFIAQTYLRFSIIAKLPSFQVIGGTTKDFSLSSLNEVLDFFRLILNMAGIDFSDKIFDIVLGALRNPATEIIGDIAASLADLVGDFSGFGIEDYGLRIKTYDVSAQIKSKFSDRTRIALGLKTKLPDLGAYVEYKWRELTDTFPFITGKSAKEGKTWQLLSVELELIVRFSFRLDTLTRSIDILDVEFFLIPSTGTDEVDVILVGTQRLLLELMFGYQAIKDLVLEEVRARLRIPLPDNWDINLARIEFDDRTNALSLNFDASERAWNPF